MSSRFGSEASRLGAEDFRVLRDVVNGYCGIDLGPDQRATVERRLRERLSLSGVESFTEYVRMLRSDSHSKAELEEAVDALTTNETYFFREQYQLRAFKEEVVPLLSKAAITRKRFSVWSAGCATGEEVYSIAALLNDAPDLSGCDIRVYGSDISKRCLAHARRGVYGASSFRATSPEAKKRWFLESADGYLVQERVRQLCHFGHLNLLEAERARAVGRVDAIFCRNVLIYLDSRSRKRVIDLFHERLYPGGVLLLGHSESLLNVSTAFELLHLRDDLVYRRPLLGFGPASSRGMPVAPIANVDPKQPSVPSLINPSSSFRIASRIAAPAPNEPIRVPTPRKGNLP
ncbi:MAG: protein-glutamate O-methyltransferase CheR [Polyangiales bacterium]